MEQGSDGGVLQARCICGQRLRIRGARSGAVVKCPRCGRSAHIAARTTSAGPPPAPAADPPAAAEPVATAIVAELTAFGGATDAAAAVATTAGEPADDRPAAGADSDAPAATADELFPAVSDRPRDDTQPLDDGQVRADLRAALSGAARPGRGETKLLEPAELAALPRATLRRNFLRDVVTTFCLAGYPQNAVQIVVTGVACALCGAIASFLGFFWPVALFIAAIVALYAVNFCWSTLTRTAAGEDEIPIIQTDWDLLEDGVFAGFKLLLITTACLGPAVFVHYYVDDAASAPPPTGFALAPYKAVLVWGLLFAGAFVWPVAILSVALGDSLLYLRPDWLVRCIIGIGPVYVVAWALMLVAIGAWFLASVLAGRAEGFPASVLLPAASWAVRLYFAWVIFRIIGLMFRHFRHRLPWKF